MVVGHSARRAACLLLAALPTLVDSTAIVLHCNNRTCKSVPAGSAEWTARASYNDSVEAIGWGSLEVVSNGKMADEDQAFAAGWAEGAVTWQRIIDHHRSFMEATFKNDSASYKTAVDFVTKNDEYVRTQVAASPGGTDRKAFWRQLGLIWIQLDGLVAGHAAHAPLAGAPSLTRLDFLLINAVVDLSSIIHKPFAEDDWTRERAARYTRETTHCSALVKLLPDFSDLLTSHNTWTAYYMMLRTAKRYTLAFRGIASATMATSGYFGTLSSTDDFSVLSSGLVVQETTNALYNATLAHAIVPQKVQTWARSLVANRLATGGEAWAHHFVYENSGTINNQWMVVDYNLFSPGHVLPPNVLWIVEQIPLYTQAADVTDILVNGHWPSYNRPFFPEVFKRSGHAAMAARYGNEYSYQLYARAKIFRRDAGNVHNRTAMRHLMRYNDWMHDPYSRGNPELSIASRSDLHEGGKPCCADGNIDAKLVGYADVAALRFEGVSGPTHEQQPIFTWTDAYRHTPHYGQPQRFSFGWEMLLSGSKREAV